MFFRSARLSRLHVVCELYRAGAGCFCRVEDICVATCCPSHPFESVSRGRCVVYGVKRDRRWEELHQQEKRKRKSCEVRIFPVKFPFAGPIVTCSYRAIRSPNRGDEPDEKVRELCKFGSSRRGVFGSLYLRKPW